MIKNKDHNKEKIVKAIFPVRQSALYRVRKPGNDREQFFISVEDDR
jgi:hypothetical protein